MPAEPLLLHGALAGYAGALGLGRRRPVPGLWLLAAALALHAAALGQRWAALGHGPFTTLHELLSSNLWSLALVAALAAGPLREVRVALPVMAPVWAVLGVWLVASDGGPGHFPATYATPLLYLHALAGKLFLGLLLVATGLALVPLLRRALRPRRGLPRWAARLPSATPGDDRLDALARRFAGAAFVCETLMLIVGAAWAQDAWGRYWDWDPLESWSLATWLVLAAALHGHAVRRPPPAVFGAWLAGVFLLAFLTFFGVPFVATAPHKGVV